MAPAIPSVDRARGWTFGGPRATISKILSWRGVAAGWLITAGVAALFLAERIPNFRQDVFCKIPLLGERWAEYRVHEEEEE